jgi:hypothetical protein
MGGQMAAPRSFVQGTGRLIKDRAQAPTRVDMDAQSSRVATTIRSAGALCGVTALGLLGALMAASPALAQPLAPVLGGTHPDSPGLSTTPRIFGRAGGVGTSGLGLRALALRAGVDPNSTVMIYADPSCSGTSVASGPLGEFEGPGIEVSVSPSSSTDFYATLTDSAEPGSPSGCSSPLTYRQVTGPPTVPTVTAVSPSSPADDNFPLVFGNAEADATITLYGDPACEGAVLGAGTGKAFSTEGIQAPVSDNSDTTFYAMASWAGLYSDCSSTSAGYRELTPPGDSGGGGGGGSGNGEQSVPPTVTPAVTVDPPGRPPAPKLRTTPENTGNDATPLIVGKAPAAAFVKVFAERECRGPVLAQGSVADLAAGLEVQVPENATTSLYGMSIDGGGDRSPCTADPLVYVEDSLAPETRITAGPAAKTQRPTAVFRFADTVEDLGVSFSCRLDRGRWRLCQSPLKLKGLGYRRHTLRVKATDAAGNFEGSPAKRSFQVLR